MMKILTAVVFFISAVCNGQSKKEMKALIKQNKEVNNWLVKTQKKAESGDQQAMYDLGYYYHKSIFDNKLSSNSRPDYYKSKQWYSKCAEMGNAACYFGLGDLNEWGRNFDIITESGIKYYQKAAELGNVQAYEKIGFSFEVNNIAPATDGLPAAILDSAIKYYLLAAQGGIVENYYRIGYLYLVSGNSEQHNSALMWFKKAADKYYQPAINMLANYKVAAENPYQKAMAIVNVSGRDSVAFGLFKIAAEINRDTSAMLTLAGYYAKGYGGITINMDTAIFWYKKVGILGSGEGSYAAGNYFLNQDIYYAATFWLHKSVAQNYKPAEALLAIAESKYNKKYNPTVVTETAEQKTSRLYEGANAGLRNSIDNLNRAIQANNNGKDKRSVCVFVQRAYEDIKAAEKDINEVVALNPMNAQMKVDQQNIREKVRSLSDWGCPLSYYGN